MNDGEHGPASDDRESLRLRNEVMARRRSILSLLERDRGTRAITLIHRKESWGEEDAHITVEDSEFVLMQIRHAPADQPIDLIVHTPGGLALAAEMIGIALKHHPARVTVMVPFYALSGGTLIALAADEILMERYSVLGPVDPQIQGMPAATLIHLLERKPITTLSDQMLVLADIARLAVENVKGFVRWLLGDRFSPEGAAAVAEFLTGGYLAHDTPITMEVLASLGLPVRAGIPPHVYDLFSTCEFGTCKRPCLASYDDARAG